MSQLVSQLVVTADEAPQIYQWVSHHGARVWKSVNLSDPGAVWVTAHSASRPHWGACNEEDSYLITNPEDILVVRLEEFRRFHVGIRPSQWGYKLTDGATRKLRRALSLAGENSTYEFDYANQDCIVYKAIPVGSLAEWHLIASQDDV